MTHMLGWIVWFLVLVTLVLVNDLEENGYNFKKSIPHRNILLTFFENIVPYHFRAIQLTFFVKYIVKVETH